MINQNSLSFMTDSDKHAYCILAHGNWEQLQLLVSVLDDERNDIFLHIDKKALSSFEIWGGKVKTNHSHIFIANSIDVRWSDVSLADAEIELFKSVLHSGIMYSRIHLISGADLPLKNQDEIHAFFMEHKDEEFINVIAPKAYIKRLKYYHFFVRYRRNRPLVDFARRILLIPQLFFVNRLRKSPLKYAYGSEWCSLSLEAIREIVDKFSLCRNMFRYTTCCDEHYKQMILISNAKFKISDKGNLRFIVFGKGSPSPKTLRVADADTLKNSKCLFARKFDMNIDCLDYLSKNHE